MSVRPNPIEQNTRPVLSAGFIKKLLSLPEIITGIITTDPSHAFPKQIPPSGEELEVRNLIENYNYVIDHIMP
jgi:hypothetical protein